MLVDPESPLKKVELTDDLTCTGASRTAKIAIKSPSGCGATRRNPGENRKQKENPRKREEKKTTAPPALRVPALSRQTSETSSETSALVERNIEIY